MELDFTSVLGRAWRITWNYKVLWIFGILASLGGGGSGSGSNFNTGSGGSGRDFNPRNMFPNMPGWLANFLDGLQRGDPGSIGIVVGLVCLLFLIGLAFYALSIIGRGGLIGGVRLANANQALTFAEAWQEGLRHFLNLFLIGLIVGVVTIVLALVTVLPGALLAVVTMGIGLLCLLPLVCVFVLAAILLSIIAFFAQIAAVVDGLAWDAALRRSWELIRSKPGPIIILGILLAIVGGLAGFVVSLPLLLAVFPAVVGFIGLSSGNTAVGNTALVVAVVCGVAYLPVLLVGNGILQTWITAAWTLAYQDLTGPRPIAATPVSVPPAPTVFPS